MNEQVKAVRIHEFGSPEVIRIDDVPQPTPNEEQILVRVAAAGVGRSDPLLRERKASQEEVVMTGECMMNKYLGLLIAGVGVVSTSWSILSIDVRANAAPAQQSAAVFNPNGAMQLPTGFRKWAFVSAPLTPNALNKKG